MKKYILFFLFSLIINVKMSAQVYHLVNKFENIPTSILNDIDKMGMDESCLLTKLEGKYFNILSQIDEIRFDMSGKKVFFFTGNAGSIKSNKKKYFIKEREILKMEDYSSSYYFGTLYIFDIAQKGESGGYDAVIVHGSKKLNSIKEVIKRLKSYL